MQEHGAFFVGSVLWHKHKMLGMNHHSHALVFVQQLGRVIHGILQRLQAIVSPLHFADDERAVDRWRI